MENAITPRTRVSGSALLFIRTTWAILTILMLGLFLVSIPIEYASRFYEGNNLYGLYLSALSVNLQFYAGFRTFMDVSLALAFSIIGIVIYLRKSDDWMVMLVSIACQSFAALFVPTLTFLLQDHPELTVVVNFVRALGLATSLIVFFYLVPNGRFTPRWTRWTALVWALMVAIWLIVPGAPANLVRMTTWSDDIQVSFIIFFIAFGSGIVAQVSRYRHLTLPIERQQANWFIFGASSGFLGFALYYIPLVFLPSLFGAPGIPRLLQIFIGIPVYHILVFLAPLCIAICTIRYRLWDIDHLINRTLIYASLTIILSLVYAASVVILDQIFRVISGYPQSNLVTAISTLAIAVLFVPLRRYIQEVFEQRFYRKRYNTDQTLIALSAALRDEVDIDVLTLRLLIIVQEIMQPAEVSLWLVQNNPTISADIGTARYELEGVPSNEGERP